MKIAVSALAFAALFFASTSCAKHDWEETKVLHEGSTPHEGGEHHGAAAEGHAEAPAHGEAAKH